MATNIQVRSVDDDLAEAAKRRAAETHRSLSAYVRDLIERDVAQHGARARMQGVLDEIRADVVRPQATRAQVLEALEQARREMYSA
ncbi:FitA-like ribbon-helix-helix domain-containing protein [Luteipulveratus flavus]|uniref:Antitoxin FitA-like ribbon-helix-helix domain-containing protein n=1 Tax=Luteipulveratus flavus TaxID=3031728 RepID=A0ABT6CAQ0_9MICO|nr:hypothetical protein [Luteipulveratus sp. YIM 133296]MDF8264371.1 hypothetical protein [Luteipulveratus sp. YIM 133296]